MTGLLDVLIYATLTLLATGLLWCAIDAWRHPERWQG